MINASLKNVNLSDNISHLNYIYFQHEVILIYFKTEIYRCTTIYSSHQADTRRNQVSQIYTPNTPSLL